MPLPQAPRWEDPESVQDAINGFRAYKKLDHDQYTDYQVGLMLENYGSEYRGIQESPAMRGQLLDQHMDKAYPFLSNKTGEPIEHSATEKPVKGEKLAGLTEESRFAGQKLSETLFGGVSGVSRLYGEGAIIGPAITKGLSLIDQDLADGWQRAYRSGFNESITGLAAAIITGDVPFEINERSPEEQDTAGAWVESATAFGMSMLYDSWFFLATRGLGLAVPLAGQAAKAKTAQALARSYFGKELIKSGEKIGLGALKKEAGDEAVEKYIKSTIRQGRKKGIVKNSSVDDAKKSIIQKMTDDGYKINTRMLDEIGESAVKLADESVAAKLASPGLSGTIKSIGGVRLRKSAQIEIGNLRRLTRHLGERGALGFGAYSVLGDIGNQWKSSLVNRINPATGETYTEGEQNNIYNRFVQDYLVGEDQGDIRERYGLPETNPDGSPMDWNLINNDWKRTFSAGMHGLVGAYTASYVGGVFKAGRDGKFIKQTKKGKPVSEGRAKWNAIQKEYGDLVYNKWGEIGVEAGAFTGTTMMLDGLLQKMGLMEEPDKEKGIKENFLHNLVTVAVLKGMGHIKKQGPEVMVESARVVARQIDKKVAEKSKKYKEASDKFGESDGQFEKNFKDEVKERTKKISKEAEIDVKELNEKVKALNNALEDKSGIDIDKSGAGKIVYKKKGFKTIVDPDTGKRIRVPNMTVEEVSSLRSLINEVTAMKDKLITKYEIVPEDLTIGGKKYKLFEALEKDVAGQGNTGELFNQIERQVRKSEGLIEKKGVDQVLAEKQVEADKAVEKAKKKAETEEKLSLISEIKEQSPLKYIYDEKGREVPFEKATIEQLRGRADGIRKSKQVTEKDSRVAEYDKMSDNLKVATFGKTLANKVSTTIKNTKGPLGDIYKKLVSMAQDGISTKAIDTQMTMARNFEKFLAKKGIHISEGTVPLMNEFLNSGNKGKPFANPGGTGSAQHYAKFVMASIKGGRYSDYKLDHKATKSKRNPLFPEEYFDAQVSFREVFKKVSGVFKVKGKEVNYEVAHAVNLIVGKLGSRSDFIFGGTGAINKKLKVGDVTEGPKYGDVKTIQVKFKGKTTKEGEIVWQFLDIPLGKEGINYYKVFKNLTKGKDAKADLITNKDGSTFTKAQYSEFAKDFLTKGKEGATGHTLRNTILTLGERMDLAVSEGKTELAVPESLKSFGKSWKEIADGLFLTHKQQTTMADRYGAFYENSPAHLQAKMTLFNKFYSLAEKVNLRETTAQKRKRIALEKKNVAELAKESEGKEQIIREEFASEHEKGDGKPMIDRLIDTKTGEIISEQLKLFIKEKPSDWHKEQIAKNRKNEPKEISILREMQSELFIKMSKVSEGSVKYDIYKKRLEQYSRLEKSALKRKLQVEVENPSRKKAVDRIINLMLQRNPGLQVVLRDKGAAGEWIDGFIKITEGKANETTFFHENVHRLETVVRGTKNKKLIQIWERGEKEVIKYAQEYHPELYELYSKNYSSKRLANELMTQLSAESALRQFNRESTWLGRRQNWVNSLVSRLKNYFGFGSMKDIARQYGDIARKGFSSDGIKLNLKQPKYQDMQKDKPSTQQEMAFEGSIKNKGIDGGMVKFLAERIPGLSERLNKDFKINKNGTIEGEITSADIQILTDMINLVDTRAFKIKRTKAHNKLLTKAHLTRVANGITKEQSKQIAKVLGIPKQSLRYANEKQLKAFLDFADKVKVKYDPYEGILQETIIEDLGRHNKDIKEIRDSGMMKGFSTDVVLRKWGLTKLADRLLDHYQIEGQMTGIGLDAIWRANKEFKSWTSLKGIKSRFITAKEIREYVPFALDPMLLEPTMIGGKKVQIAPDKGRDKFIEQSKIEGTPEHKATKILKQMYKDYYDAFMEASLSNIKNPAMRELFKEKYQPKFVEDYFTRVLTKEARNLLGKDDAKFNEIAKKIELNLYESRNNKLEKDIVKYDNLRLQATKGSIRYKEYDKMVRELVKEQTNMKEGFLDKNSEISQEIHKEAINYLRGLTEQQSYTVDSKYLHDRQPRLDNILTTADGKQIKTYETDFETVFNKYQRNMSSFIATAKYLPEFTSQLKPYISGKSADISGDMLKALSQGDYAQRYVALTINRQIGNVHKPEIGERFATKLATGSAMAGLSSTLSGIKNFMIGSNMTIGVMGAGNYLRAMSELHRADHWIEARRMGRLQFGTKEVELGKWSELLGRKISLMNTTESINRIVGSRAGELTAMQLFKNIAKEGSMLKSVKNSEAKLNRLFRLSASEIAHIKKYGFMSGEGLKGLGKERRDSVELERQRIVEKIKHYGHITTQGSSGNPFLPIWAGSGTGKALTLFYRMAYSGTANIWHHIIKPAKNGDLLPLIRYPMAAALSGGAYWSLMENILGTKNPKANEDQLAILGANLSKAETLGIYSFLLNPYSSGDLGDMVSPDLLTQPAIIRNMVNFASLLNDLRVSYTTDDNVNLTKSFKDMLFNTVTAAGHARKIMQKKDTPFLINSKSIRTFRFQFHRKLGGDSLQRYNKGNVFSEKFGKTERQEMYGLVKKAFQGSEEDLKKAAHYYMATWYTIYDKQRFLESRLGRNHKKARQFTDSALQQVIKQINPMHFSSQQDTGLMYNEKKEFIKYLTPENRVVAINLEKEYWVRKRKFDKYLKEAWSKHGGYYKRGEIVELLPYPPQDIDKEFKLRPSGIQRLIPKTDT